MEGLGKKEKGLMDMDNSVVIAGREGSIRGLNSNGKYNKDYIYCLKSSNKKESTN